jgi:excisionase family DNA binding protein
MFLVVKDDLLTIPRASRLCGMSRGTIWKYVKNGEIKASMTPGGQYRITQADFNEFLQRNNMYPHACHEPDDQRILMVDDEPQILKLLTTMLSENGYCLETAKDGFDAGVKIMTFKPGLVILDLIMPGMDGFEVCRQIKTNPDTAHIKVLAVTGHDSEENREKILLEGADAYLTKPFSKNELMQTIQTLLNTRTPNTPAANAVS